MQAPGPDRVNLNLNLTVTSRFIPCPTDKRNRVPVVTATVQTPSAARPLDGPGRAAGEAHCPGRDGTVRAPAAGRPAGPARRRGRPEGPEAGRSEPRSFSQPAWA